MLGCVVTSYSFSGEMPSVYSVYLSQDSIESLIMNADPCVWCMALTLACETEKKPKTICIVKTSSKLALRNITRGHEVTQIQAKHTLNIDKMSLQITDIISMQ